MFRKALLVGYMLSAMGMVAQNLPTGTALPVMLHSPIDGGKTVPGTTVKARLMQDVNLPSGLRIPAGATVLGDVVEVAPPGASSGSRLVFKFDRLLFDKRTLHFSSHLRALASRNEVFDAQLPTNAIDDFGTTVADWVTVQVGGNELVYRGDGTVMAANQVVGSADSGGAVRAKLQVVDAAGCHASSEPQSLWVFSTTACGVYGYEDTTIAHRGRTDPIGEVVLTSHKKVRVQGGSGLLLVTN
jgi:hypothetical protein